MDIRERDELAELIVRAINTARDAADALIASPFDMENYRRTDELACDARREVWQCLYSIRTADGPLPIRPGSNGSGPTQP